jgi:hypothetical protein
MAHFFGVSFSGGVGASFVGEFVEGSRLQVRLGRRMEVRLGRRRLESRME